VWSGNQEPVTLNETFSRTMSYTLITAHLPESQVATQLLDAIKAKETADKIATILDSLTSLDPELGQNRDSKEQRKQHLHVQYTPSSLPQNIPKFKSL